MQSPNFRVDNQVAFVTGAGSGLGQAIAIALAQAGADVAITELPGKEAAAEATAKEIKAGTLDALERGPALYREYFLLKWRRSLKMKQAAWPGHYDFTGMLRERSLTGMTARMVEEYTDYPDLETYLQGYAVTGEALASLETESRIITALDDPMILPGDLRRLKRVPALDVTVTRRGGHCGFVERLGGPTWIDREVMAELTRD